MKRFFSALLVVIAVSALLVGLVSTLARTRYASAIPGLRGAVPLVVLSGSMEPHIKVGSILFIKEADASQLEVGDVITFRTPIDQATLTTHRIVGIEPGQAGPVFSTKGDANKTEDNWEVPASNVMGEAVTSVPYLGRLSVFVRGTLGFALLIALPALLLVAGEVRGIMGELRGRRSPDAVWETGDRA